MAARIKINEASAVLTDFMQRMNSGEKGDEVDL